MIDSMNKLTTIMVLGNLIKEDINKQQEKFNKSNPYLNAREKQTAEETQHLISVLFNNLIKENQLKGKGYDGFDKLELKLWAPNEQCALAQLHDYLQEEYGLFPKVALSTGIKRLCSNKLYFIGILIRKSTSEDLFGIKEGMGE